MPALSEPSAVAVPTRRSRGAFEPVASGTGSGPSLRSVLALSMAGVALAATVALATLVTREATGRMEAEVGAQLSEVAAHMAANLDQGLFERWRDIQIAATLDTLRSASDASADKEAVLRGIQQTYSNYSIVGLIDAQGIITSTSLGILVGADVSGRDYFIAGRRGPYVGDVHDAMLLAKILPGQQGEPLRLIDLAAPVRDPAGNFVGVVAAHLNWTWAREMADGLARSLTGHRTGSEILVLGKDGRVILGPEGLRGGPLPDDIASPEPSGGSGSRVGGWPDDRSAYLSAVAATVGYRDYPGLGWRVVVRQKADRALASVAELRRGILVAGSLVALSAGLIAWYLAGRIARPLRDLALAAEALGRDDPLPVLADPVVREGRRIAEALVASAAGIRRREATHRLLIDELNHRVKNTLATVQSLAAQSFRGTGDAARDARRTFDARLFALSAAHNVLTAESWQGADVRDLVADALSPFDDGLGRVSRAGPAVYLRPQPALALSMMLHELATNATKHGALCVPGGRVEVAWTLTSGERGRTFRVSWAEAGGTGARLSGRTGFGTRLLRRGLGDGEASSVEMAFTPDGELRYASSLHLAEGPPLNGKT